MKVISNFIPKQEEFPQKSGISKSLLTMLLCVANLSLVWGEESLKATKQHLATDIADNYIRSFASQPKQTKNDKALEATKDKGAHRVRPAKLDPATQRKVIFNQILAKSKMLALKQAHMEPILNEYAWDDLKLFYGTTSAPGYHLLARINKTITTLGEAALATLLVTPTSNLPTLLKRQAIIKTLLAHPREVEALKNSLQLYQDSEQSMVSFWTNTDPLYAKEYDNYMNNKFYAKNNAASNKSAKWLETKKRFFRDFLGIQFRFLYPITPPIIAEIFFRKDLLEHPTLSKTLWKMSIPYYGGWFKWDLATQYDRMLGKKPSKWELVRPILGEVIYTWSAYTGVSNYLEYAAVLRNLALRMADVQAFVVTAQQMNDQITALPVLETIYGEHLTAVRKLLAQSKENTELGKLMDYLQNLPLNNWSYFLNNAGKLLASYKLFVEHKKAFSDAMYEIGLLDAYLSFATLMQASKAYDKKHAYVFAQFLNRQQKDKPYIKIQAMWNPFLDAKQAIGNSLEMDAAPGGIRNIILTGPNAGGKSTFLTGITNTLLLAHVVGIGPADEITITPFNKISTYINVADDIAAGKSLFMAEVDRAQKHIKLLQQLKEDEFSFAIFDEPFSGTNPIEGAAAEYSILEAIAEHTNTFNLVATHYPTVMLLEDRAKDKGFANYKVYITRKGLEHKLNYTYKIIPGKSMQAIAIDILEENGYDTKMLKRAREIIEHPEHYQANF